MPPSLSKFLVIVPGELDDSPPFYLKDWLLYKTPQWSPSSLSHLHHFRSFYKDFCTVCLRCQLDLLLVSFWWPDYSTWAARFPSWRSQRLLPWRQHLAALWPGSTAGRCCRHFHTNPGAPLAQEAIMSPSPPRLASTDPSHDTCNLCSAWYHQTPLWKIVPFVPYLRNITHQRGLILWFRSSSPQHNPQARQKLKHWTTSPLVSAPVDKYWAHQQ